VLITSGHELITTHDIDRLSAETVIRSAAKNRAPVQHPGSN
jgi:hypothetical protein